MPPDALWAGEITLPARDRSALPFSLRLSWPVSEVSSLVILLVTALGAAGWQDQSPVCNPGLLGPSHWSLSSRLDVPRRQ